MRARLSRTLVARALVLAGAIALAAAPGAAADFTAPAPVGGFGSSPLLTSLAVAPSGMTALAGTIATGNRRQPVIGFGNGGPPASVRPLGPAGNVRSQPQVRLDDRGDGAVVWSIGGTVRLRLCRAGRCGSTMIVGRSQRNPQAQVAVNPASGRVTVLWRGTASGRNRLQWRTTTNGRLGAKHTLGEFGSTPQIGTDAAGKTVAVWIPSRGSGVRTAVRRRGEFTRPTTVTPKRAQDLRLSVAPDGDTIAAWRVPAPGGADVQAPRGAPTVSTRTRRAGFDKATAIEDVDDASTLSLALGPDGHAVLAFVRQADDGTATASAAYRPGHGQDFGSAADLGPLQIIAPAFGASAAVDGQGTATVIWGAGSVANDPSGQGVYVSPRDSIGDLQLLEIDSAAGTSGVSTLAAAGGSTTVLVWAGPEGVRASRSG
jgi:hypothetical protein